MNTMIMQALAEDRTAGMRADAAVARRAREARRARGGARRRRAGFPLLRRAGAQPSRSPAAAANT
ncbi:MAG TPA: hypothetical protein VMI33_03535 [Streptosporangiaceae bacterium]|nr:hypothetical protein [Streptosporangiaceae bacterium]